MRITYTFNNPAELAGFLERKADDMVARACQLRNGGSMTQRDVELFSREAAGIRAAADILRHSAFKESA